MVAPVATARMTREPAGTGGGGGIAPAGVGVGRV